MKNFNIALSGKGNCALVTFVFLLVVGAVNGYGQNESRQTFSARSYQSKASLKPAEIRAEIFLENALVIPAAIDVDLLDNREKTFAGQAQELGAQPAIRLDKRQRRDGLAKLAGGEDDGEISTAVVFNTQNLRDELKANSQLKSKYAARCASEKSLFTECAAETFNRKSLNFPDTQPADNTTAVDDDKFHWKPAIEQSLMFLGIQHGYAMTQPKTRRALKGKFFQDYFDSVKSLHGWDDGGRFFTNYIAHPMQGAFTGFIYVQNHHRERKIQFNEPGYWKSRMKAMAWTAAWSTQFEIGPISQASIGNVGLSGKQTYVDIVMTPTAGTGLLIAEDAVDRYIMRAIERHTGNYYTVIFSRMLLSPTRTLANVLRFKLPWYRERPREY